MASRSEIESSPSPSPRSARRGRGPCSRCSGANRRRDTGSSGTTATRRATRRPPAPYALPANPAGSAPLTREAAPRARTARLRPGARRRCGTPRAPPSTTHPPRSPTPNARSLTRSASADRPRRHGEQPGERAERNRPQLCATQPAPNRRIRSGAPIEWRESGRLPGSRVVGCASALDDSRACRNRRHRGGAGGEPVAGCARHGRRFASFAGEEPIAYRRVMFSGPGAAIDGWLEDLLMVWGRRPWPALRLVPARWIRPAVAPMARRFRRMLLRAVLTAAMPIGILFALLILRP